MMFTTRQGLWEAWSASDWIKQCSQVHGGLIFQAEAEKLFTEAVPEEVNDSTKFWSLSSMQSGWRYGVSR